MKTARKEIGDLFEVESSKKIYNANSIEIKPEKEGENYFPYISRSTEGNGLQGFISEDKNNLNSSGTITFAQDTFVAFYQDVPYFTGNRVKILIPKEFELSRRKGIYFAAAISKSVSNLNWGTSSTLQSIVDTKIEIPVKDEDSEALCLETIEEIVKEVEDREMSKIESLLLRLR